MEKLEQMLFHELNNQVRSLNLPRNRWYYNIVMTRTFMLFVSALGLSAVITQETKVFAAQIPVMLIVGFALGQALLLSHDNEHGQIACGLFPRTLYRKIVNALSMGITEMWYIKHILHHTHPNNPLLDPDARVHVLALDKKSAEFKYGLTRILVKYQAYLFPIMSCFTMWSLRIVAIKYGFNRNIKECAYALTWNLVGACIYISSLTVLLGSVSRAFMFVVVSDGITGFYLGMVFLVNHCGMSMASKGGYLKIQVESSRNISGNNAITNAFYTFLLGGLNRQIEHHLWPTMPRYNLLTVSAYVEKFCIKHRILYKKCSLFLALKESYGHLETISKHVKKIDRERRNKVCTL